MALDANHTPGSGDHVGDHNLLDAALGGKAPLIHTQTASTITDFVEAAQDAVAAMLAGANGVTLSYNDAGNTLTITGTGTGGVTDPETVRDTIGAALLGVGLVSVTVNDAADTITITTAATQNRTDAQTDTLLAAKAPAASPTFTGTVSGVTKASVGLGSVDNTSDAGKPVSTAQAAAINAAIANLVTTDTLTVATDELTARIAEVRGAPNPYNLYPVYYADATGWPSVDALTLLLPVVWIGGTVQPPQGRWTGAYAHVWLKADGTIVTYAARYDFEGMTAGAAIDTAALASGQQWDVTSTTAAGVTAVAQASPVYAGIRSGKFTTGTTAAQVWAAWRGRGSTTESTLSALFYLTSYPPSNTTLLRRRVQTSPGVYGSSSGARITPAGIVDFMDASFNVMYSTPSAIPLNTWVAIEDHRVASATPANQRASAWVQPVGGAVVVLGDDTTVRNAGTSLDEHAVGILANVASWSVSVDEVRLGASGRQFATL